MERTFAMIKPDGVRRGLTGKIIQRLEDKGFKIVALKKMRISFDLAEEHYGEHKEKPFFKPLVEFITSGPVVAMVLEGPGVIAELRKMMGATNPADALPGTIRGDFATTIDENVIHGSANEADAEREIGLFFKPEEFVS
ncbi:MULTISPECIES: nucleoside-diphosphate kinase [Oceanithermus]|uniref:Nucleoside diphosphate kinase n=2 Tax=Oceanithermus desulfurans TaxID=227924 RepID=A0A511RM97_9DEIN|nr:MULTISPECIES: nucleoside-diphosphate kinase [Oceanithermus]MBB6030518.1 nucleoside-diphosphate kinase [Oceanithermus desulfurans]GEM90072.1 nucleoside diphosphate kinase [Oceanithermus desulfurans NBRC 100063]